MRRRLLAWAASAALLSLVGAAPAMADVVPGSQAVGQTAGSQQAANADASSTQVQPTNQNIAVRVLSPGDSGAVTQSNTSDATAAAANANAALQAAAQAAPAAGGTQVAGQTAENTQAADAGAQSTQVKPTNENVSVRVLSPGDDGSVTQDNSSSAAALAADASKTAQPAEQAGGGAGGGGGTQAVAQQAASDQNAGADATSAQDHPSNVNAPTRVLSEGDGGDVEQANTSTARSAALNANETMQKPAQDQGGSAPVSNEGDGCGCTPKPAVQEPRPCGCDASHPATAIQAIGQQAHNQQNADAEASSKQVDATNVNAPVRVQGGGDDGSVSQSNDSFAGAIAANKDATGQAAQQAQGELGFGAIGIQAVGQKAESDQNADADATSLQLGAKNVHAPVGVFSPGGGGDVSQSNSSFAGALALNENATLQDAFQVMAGGSGPLAIQAIGQAAFGEQGADADATSGQLWPANVDAPVQPGDGKGDGPAHRYGPGEGSPRDAGNGAPGQAPVGAEVTKGGDGSVEQANDSAALAAALNANWTEQFAFEV